MTEEDYDKIFAPRLRAIADEINEAGGSAVLCVDFETADGERSTGTRIALLEKRSAHVGMMATLAKAGENFDAYAMAIMRQARREGHSSVVLRQLGIHESGGDVRGRSNY